MRDCLAQDWRARLQRVPGVGACCDVSQEELAAVAVSLAVPAAVLVPVVNGAEPAVLLTKRTAHLRAHAGQISFPGGRIDPEDATPEHAALREAHEEIGLPTEQVTIIGRLTDHITGSGYRITPVLGILPPDLRFVAAQHEVESIFLLPLSTIMDPSAPRQRRVLVQGHWRTFWTWPHAEHDIWGATAAILVDLAQRLRAA